MPKYIAFLRAINISGHTVKMDRLRQVFESFGFRNVETFIASGNVVFDSDSSNPRNIESEIESGLRADLGFDVPTFIRTTTELVSIANYKAFEQKELDNAAAFNVFFLKSPLDAESKRKLLSRETDIDNFTVHGREVYWLSRRKQSESTFSNVVLEKTIRSQSTLRGFNTIKRMMEKWI